MIKTFTKDLPYRLSEQLMIEHKKRLSDVIFFISGQFEYYSKLKEDLRSIELLLALSIFHKRVLTNFESATKFSSKIVLNSDAESIQLGTYELTSKEIFKLNRTVVTFRQLMADYSIPNRLFEYSETKEFLRKIKLYKDSLDLTNDNNG